MADIQIHDLSALPGTITTGNVFAVDTGDATYKIDYDALATAIISKLGGDPVTIAHGGTGTTGTSSATTLTPTNADSRITAHNIYLYQWGKVCFLYVRIACNFSATNFTPGSNLDFTLSGAPAPVQPVTGATFYGSNIMATRFDQSKLVRYRNTANTQSGSAIEMITCFTYLTA